MLKKITTFVFLIIFLFAFELALTNRTNASEPIGGTITTGVTSSTGSTDGVVKAAPTVSPAAGDYHATQSVSLTASGATAICYTVDGTTPACATSATCTTGSVYSSAISVTSSKTIQSVGCYGDGSQGPAGSAAYTLTCSTASVSNGTVAAYSSCAITCNSGYTLSGSTCVSSGGGGSSSGSSATTPTTQQTSVTTADGTQTTTITSSSNGTASAAATINTVSSPTNGQTISLNTSAVAEVNKVDVNLSVLVMQKLVADYGSDTDLTVNITSQAATSLQQSSSALTSGTFLVGLDVFTIDISAGGTSITSFTNPLTISFDVSDIPNPENLSIAWFDTALNKWVDLGGTLSGGILTITVNHLTDFAVIKKATSSAEAEATAITAREQQIANILNESLLTNNSSSDLSPLLSHNGVVKNTAEQTAGMAKYTDKLTAGVTGLTTGNINAINNFIVYGTQTTKVLGAGERAGVVNSYKSAFGKVPTTAAEWADVIKIGNGRWPTARSTTAEAQATVEFKKVYKRSPDMNQQNDNAAVTVIAYGLRPGNRNLNSEKAAIKSFKAIYAHNPVSALAWDIVRAIAYSGAKR